MYHVYAVINNFIKQNEAHIEGLVQDCSALAAELLVLH